MTENKSKASKAKSRGTLSMRHSIVSLTIDLENAVLKGYVEHKLVNKTKNISTIRFHARQMVVSQILVNGENVKYEHMDYITSPCSSKENIRDLKQYNILHKNSLDEEDKGGLIISVPTALSTSIGLGSPFSVRIYYTLTNPTAGIHFILPRKSQVSTDEEYGVARNESLPLRHLFSHNEVESARCWIPCLDRYSQPCTWSLYYHTLPVYTVISSGDLVDPSSSDLYDKQAQEEGIDLKTSHYEITIPTTIKNLALAAGDFASYVDPTLPTVTYYSFPHEKNLMEHTTRFMGQAYKYYEEYLSVSFPYGSYKVVFVANCYTKMSSFAGLAIMSSKLLHGPTIIDKTIKSRWLLSLALAIQYFGNFIGVKSWSDTWLQIGLSSHLAGTFFKAMYGAEEYRLVQFKNSISVAKLDDGKPPLNWSGPLHPIQYFQPLFLKKAPIVIDMIEKKLSPTKFRKLCSSLANPALHSNSHGDGRLSTRVFLKSIKLEGWKDIKLFEQQWISGRGYPKMLAGFSFNKKHQQTEFVVKQTAFLQNEHNSGPLLVRINELDGSYDYSIPISEEVQGIDLRCQTRLRKNRKKKIHFLNGEEVEIDLSRRDNPLLWIRVDPLGNWGPLIEFRQPEYMWVYQMELDRDPIAQYQAIHALCSSPTLVASNTLSDTMANSKIFYHIRVEAARGLAECANKEMEWISLDKLLKFFRGKYYDATDNRVVPNDFSNVAEYHLKKSVIESVATIKDKDGYTPSDVILFLLQLLENNENGGNKYSDYKYKATIIRSLAKTNTSSKQNTEKIVQQIKNMLKKETENASFQRKVTVACLKSLAELQVNQKLDLPISLFKQFSRYGHKEVVRLVAIKCMIWLFYPCREVFSEIKRVLEDQEESPRLKYKILSGWSEFITTNRIGVAVFQEGTEDNIELCNFLWSYLNSSHTSFDSRLRWTAIELYKNLWGLDTPSCLPPIKVLEVPPKLRVPVVPEIPLHVPALKDKTKKISGAKRKPHFAASFSSDSILKIKTNPAKRQKLEAVWFEQMEREREKEEKEIQQQHEMEQELEREMELESARIKKEYSLSPSAPLEYSLFSSESAIGKHPKGGKGKMRRPTRSVTITPPPPASPIPPATPPAIPSPTVSPQPIEMNGNDPADVEASVSETLLPMLQESGPRSFYSASFIGGQLSLRHSPYHGVQ